MLGELAIEGKWKIVGMRVLPDKRMEVTFQESGTIYGIEYSGVATVWTVGRPDGTVYGKGHALLTTNDGEQLSWKGIGVGQPKGGMAISYRGCKSFEASSQRLAKLNKIAVVFEAEADKNGDGWHKHWEWK
jgi:hypothetical protein